jgi:hypothetical protein
MAVLRLSQRVSPPVAIVSAIAVLAVPILAGSHTGTAIVVGAVGGYFLGLVVIRIAANWSWLVYGLAAADLIIPEDNRYTLHGSGGLGFQLEPYRLIITIVVIGWVAALMVDPRVRARRTGFDGPLMFIWFAIIGSEAFNPARVSPVESTVIKQLILMVSLTLFVYAFVSVIRSRDTIERLLTVLVSSGLVVAVGALLERATKYNFFNHLHKFLPMFQFDSTAELLSLLRNGHFRAIASAGHPIELANDMAMLTPLAVYLAIRRDRRWWAAVPVLLLGNLCTGSRTGIIGLIAVLAVFIRLRPRQTLRCWPALIPMLAVLQLAMPGAISGTISAFFPKGGLIAQQNETFAAHGQVQYASRLSRVGPQLHNVFEKHNELFGEGYGTRIVGRVSAETVLPQTSSGQILDDQWLGNLLEIGIFGVFGWIWLFTRVVRRLGSRALRERASPDGWLPVALAASITCYAISMYFYDASGFMQATVLMYILLGCAGSLLWLPVSPGRSATSDARENHNGRQAPRQHPVAAAGVA